MVVGRREEKTRVLIFGRLQFSVFGNTCTKAWDYRMSHIFQFGGFTHNPENKKVSSTSLKLVECNRKPFSHKS